MNRTFFYRSQTDDSTNKLIPRAVFPAVIYQSKAGLGIISILLASLMSLLDNAFNETCTRTASLED